MKIQAAIFDMDGTLVDSVDLHAQAWQRVLAEYGKGIPYDTVRSQIGKGSDTFLPTFFDEEELSEIKEKISKRRSSLFTDEYLDQVKPFPQVRELFERLHAAGIKIALASSGSAGEIKHYQKLLNVTELVDEVATADDAEKSKPHPDIFQAALDKLGKNIVPANSFALGDTPYDADAAGKLGLRTVGMLCGGFSEESLRDAGATTIFHDPADLLTRYEQTPFAGN